MIQRIYSRNECDAAGVPLDYECCRACGSLPRDVHSKCSRCGGHGSLKAAVLVLKTRGQCLRAINAPEGRWQGGEYIARCEDCGHPMSEGTWEGEQGMRLEALTLRALLDLRQHGDTDFTDGLGVVHYSSCDEGCRHAGPVLKRNAYGRPGGATYDELPPVREGFEASWPPGRCPLPK